MSTIIESFLVTLGLDTTGMATGEREAQRGLKNLEASTRESAKHIKEQGMVAGEFYDHLLEKAMTFFAFIAGGAEVKEFVKSTVEMEISTMRLSKLLGISIEEVQKWQGAVVLADGSVEGFSSSMKALGGSLIDIEKNLPRSERALKVLKAAGITGLAKGKKSDLLQVLDQLSIKMSKMSGMEAIRLGSRIGLDSSFIRVLRKGTDGIEELKNKAASFGLFTKEEAEKSEKLKETWNALGLMGKALARETVMEFMVPAMQKISDILEMLGVWAKKYPDGMKTIFFGLASGMVAATVAGVGMSLSMSPLIAAMGSAALAAAILAAAAYEIYRDWERYMPLLEDMIPGIGSTLEVAKQGMTELGKMYKEMFTGSEEEAEKAATRYMTKLRDVADRIIREVMWEILDIPYKIIQGLDEALKLVGRANPFLLGSKEKSKPEVRGMKHLAPSGIPDVQGRDTSYLGGVAGGAGGEWDWRALFRPQAYAAPAAAAPPPSLHVETVQILTNSQDPAEHASLFTEAVGDNWAKRLASQSNSGVR